jgi:hypothetical protein
MEHYYQKLYDGWFDFEDVYSQAVANAPVDKPSTFIEIGAWLGKSISFLGVEIINSGKPITLYVCDAWAGSPSEGNEMGYVTPQDVYINRFGKDAAYAEFLKNVAPVLPILHILRMPSEEASKTFEDKSLDFVFIDADHSFPCINADLTNWLPKVKPGGTIAGHDLLYVSVKKAVDIHLGEYERLGGSGNSWRKICS